MKNSSGAIQMRAKDNSGIVTTGSGGTATKVTIAWGEGNAEGRAVDVYGSTEAYSSAADLYKAATRGDSLGSIALGSTELEISGETAYSFIGLRSTNGAVYLDRVEIEWSGEAPPKEFSIKLMPSFSGGSVRVGDEATITASAQNAAGDVTYNWSAEGVPGSASGAVFTIDTGAAGGPYTVTCNANDTESDADPVDFTFSIAEAPVITGGMATYTVKSKTSVEASGDVPEGSEAIYAQTANNVGQITSNNTATLTLKGYEGTTITGLTLSMKSNASKGKGALSVTCGSAVIASIADANFGDPSWHGDWSTEYVDVKPAVTATAIDDDVVIQISGSVNSLYCQSYTVVFEAGEPGMSVTLDKADGFTVPFGQADSIRAEAKNGAIPYSYSWECATTPELNGSGEVLEIPATLAAGAYSVTLTVTDSAEPQNEKVLTIGFSVVAKHSITVDGSIANGTISADKTEAAEGELVTLKATPDGGYKLETFLLDGTPISGNTFDMPARDVTVSATFVAKPVVSGDVLTNEDVGHQTTSYKDWTATKDSGAVYAGQTAGGSSNNPCIQLRTSSPAGVVMTKGSGQNVSAVAIEWNAQSATGRVVQVYGSATAYTAVSDLFGDAKGTLLGAVTNGATESTVDVAAVGEYPYIGIRSKDGALYLSSVTISFGGEAKPSISGTVENEMLLGDTASATFTLGGATATGWTASLGSIADGEWTWKPTASGTFTLTVTATYEGGSAEATYEILVKDSSAFERFTKVESLAALTDGEYLVVGANSDAFFAMTTGLSSGLALGTSVEVKSDEEVPYILTDKTNLAWTVTYSASAGLTISSAQDNYLGYDSTKADNKLWSFEGVSDASTWTVAFTEEGGLFTLTSAVQDKDGSDRCLRFNYNNGNTRFAGYKASSTSMKDVAFFKKGASAPSVSLSASATEVEIDEPVTITAMANNFSSEVEWSWTGNGTANGATFSVDTSVAGTYEVTATATAGTESASNTVSITVKSTPPPEGGISCNLGTSVEATVGKSLHFEFTVIAEGVTSAGDWDAWWVWEEGEAETSKDVDNLIVSADGMSASFDWEPSAVGSFTLNVVAEGQPNNKQLELAVPVTVSEGGSGGAIAITGIRVDVAAGKVYLTTGGDTVKATASLATPDWQPCATTTEGGEISIPLDSLPAKGAFFKAE